MEELKDKKIGTLVAEDYRFADVFKKYGIDFCCGGGISIEEACKKKSLNQQELIQELIAIKDRSNKTVDFNSWELDVLVAHIINAHHTYVKNNLPYIREYAAKVAKVHGQHHPETIQIYSLVDNLFNELMPHMDKEEIILFPYINKLVAAKRGHVDKTPSAFGSVEDPIRMMEEEHDVAGDLMKSISELSGGYTPPESACTTYRVLYQKLQDFENDLHQHIHLENNILFPKAIEMEKAGVL